MSEEKQPKPTKKFGSISSQYATIGGGPEVSQDTITSKAPDTLEMKRQTVYMPKNLATRLKIHAAATGEDISGIITELVEQFLEREEGKP